LGIYHALTSLESQDYLTAAADLPNEVAAFWSLQGVDPRVAVQDTRVAVTAFGTVKTEPFISALESLARERLTRNPKLAVFVKRLSGILAFSQAMKSASKASMPNWNQLPFTPIPACSLAPTNTKIVKNGTRSTVALPGSPNLLMKRKRLSGLLYGR
jgi:hypothetical protein